MWRVGGGASRLYPQGEPLCSTPLATRGRCPGGVIGVHETALSVSVARIRRGDRTGVPGKGRPPTARGETEPADAPQRPTPSPEQGGEQIGQRPVDVTPERRCPSRARRRRRRAPPLPPASSR